MYLEKHGWPNCINPGPEKAKDYLASRSKQSVIEGILLFRDNVVIPWPEKHRSEILETIHDGHMGISKCYEGQQTLYNGLDYQDMDNKSDELRNLPKAKSNPEEGTTEKNYNSTASLAEDRRRLVWN